MGSVMWGAGVRRKDSENKLNVDLVNQYQRGRNIGSALIEADKSGKDLTFVLSHLLLSGKEKFVLNPETGSLAYKVDDYYVDLDKENFAFLDQRNTVLRKELYDMICCLVCPYNSGGK